MSCTAYTVYTFQLTLQYANFGQFEAKQVLSGLFFLPKMLYSVHMF